VDTAEDRHPLSSDSVFGDGWDAELASVTGDPATRVMIALTIGIGEKSASTPPGGAPPSGGPPPNGRRPVRAHRAERAAA
jgi:hypothetical protein